MAARRRRVTRKHNKDERQKVNRAGRLALTIIWGPFNLPGMDDEQILLDEITAYCAASGTKPSTFGLKALGNSRFVDRLRRRIARSAEDAKTVRAFMLANPPATRPDAKGRD